MTPQEETLVRSVFERMRAEAASPREPGAAALIDALTREAPWAPYLLVRRMLMLEEALRSAQTRLADLEGRTGGGAAPSFLPPAAGTAGPWGARPSAAPAPVTAAAPPTSYAPPPASALAPAYAAPAAAPAGGGFLRGAMQTATGVAAGALAVSAIEGLLRPGGWGGGGWGGGGAGWTAPGPTVLEERIVEERVIERVHDAPSVLDDRDRRADAWPDATAADPGPLAWDDGGTSDGDWSGDDRA